MATVPGSGAISVPEDEERRRRRRRRRRRGEERRGWVGKGVCSINIIEFFQYKATTAYIVIRPNWVILNCQLYVLTRVFTEDY